MSKNYRSFIYTVQIVLVLTVNTILNAIFPKPDVSNSASVSLSFVLVIFLIYTVIKSYPLADTLARRQALWISSLVITVGTGIIFFVLKESQIESFSIFFGILFAFLVNYAGNIWLNGKKLGRVERGK